MDYHFQMVWLTEETMVTLDIKYTKNRSTTIGTFTKIPNNIQYKTEKFSKHSPNEFANHRNYQRNQTIRREVTNQQVFEHYIYTQKKSVHQSRNEKQLPNYFSLPHSKQITVNIDGLLTNHNIRTISNHCNGFVIYCALQKKSSPSINLVNTEFVSHVARFMLKRQNGVS